MNSLFNFTELMYKIMIDRSMVDLCEGSIENSLVLVEIHTNSNRSNISEGWFSKSKWQWFNELRLSELNVENATNYLLKKGWIEVKQGFEDNEEVTLYRTTEKYSNDLERFFTLYKKYPHKTEVDVEFIKREYNKQAQNNLQSKMEIQ